MEIDAKVFKYWMACIADRTGRVLTAPTYAEYHRLLSAELTTEQFAEAARLVFRNSEFWPAPRAFIDAIKPDPRLRGAVIFEWIRTHRHFNGTHAYWVAEEIEGEFGAPALAAFRAIGGGERFATMEAHELPHALRDFCDAYVRAVGDAAKPPADWRQLPRTAVNLKTSTALLGSGTGSE